MTEALILDAVRTPIGRKGGVLAHYRSDDLAAEVLKALVTRNEIQSDQIEDVILGCVTQIGEQGVNVARNAVLASDFPVTVPGTTINRLCGSGLQACNFAAQAVQSGHHNLVIGGGTESMSRVTMGSDAGAFSEQIQERFDLVNQGIAAEFVAKKYQLSREEIDQFSFESHQKAVAADFSKEILPIDGVTKDEGPRADTSLEKIASLKPAFDENGVITAANSSQISDGAAALLIASSDGARQMEKKPRARFVSTAVTGVDPTLMLTGPISSTQLALQKAGLKKDDIDIFECNEAFAPVVLAWLKETGVDPKRVNVNGGAVALGHPLGATGARLIVTALHELEKRNEKRALVTLCIGLGQGMATIIERI